MNSLPTRRLFIRTSVGLLAASLVPPGLSAQSTSPAPGPGKPPPRPPALPPAKVQAVVGQAHRSLEEVRKLVEDTPLLVNAVWDWGGGDFETPLEAAAHTGRREIAEYLLAKGARPSLFAAGMLGQLPVVQAHLALDPRAHEIPGPHGFTLLHCVRQGGAAAQSVADWLVSQGVPDVKHRALPYVWRDGTAPAGT